MLGDILVCSFVAILVIAVIAYKVKEAKKAKQEGRCGTCSCCSGSTSCSKRAYQFEDEKEECSKCINKKEN